MAKTQKKADQQPQKTEIEKPSLFFVLVLSDERRIYVTVKGDGFLGPEIYQRYSRIILNNKEEVFELILVEEDDFAKWSLKIEIDQDSNEAMIIDPFTSKKILVKISKDNTTDFFLDFYPE